MPYRTTTDYGTWCNQVREDSTSPDDDVTEYALTGDRERCERIEKSGVLEEMQHAYRKAIAAALPPGITLTGDEFIGPAYPEDDEFDAYPHTRAGALDFAAMVEDIDLAPIVEDWEPLTLEEIGRGLMQSKAADPAKAASRAMQRAGLKPDTYLPHPHSGRPQAIYFRGRVREALAQRPGRSWRAQRPEAAG
ncbi:hypothetical protein [Streptomyces clavuligerus]|uniref:hypothetical protein n=1 Tax=Streptomyces clavuligerus TaxID=1901 RepID=UPI0001800B2B|nr:hypothetical protein [Streptomyces clavuligerus]EDY53065.1 hypothetical protein SSCG_06043 [Streptomyces clavuligerus]WDN56018.1 hypothetical protein LL058_29480 [Streptomyces clavuligerus]